MRSILKITALSALSSFAFKSLPIFLCMHLPKGLSLHMAHILGGRVILENSLWRPVDRNLP